MKQIEDIKILEEIAEQYVCMLCDKKIRRVKKELSLMENDKLKELIIRKFNKRMQLMNATFYELSPNLEIRIGG
ncbi:MAG: hypothetical protein NC548_51560 [Lachnospiraceae bacterium]|nr:hypothetical protein [Lachnospiraceae bacterium]